MTRWGGRKALLVMCVPIWAGGQVMRDNKLRVVVSGPELRIVVCTHAACTALARPGVSASDLVGMCFLDFVHPADRAATLQRFIFARSAQADSVRLIHRRAGDGGRLVFEWALTSLEQIVEATVEEITLIEPPPRVEAKPPARQISASVFEYEYNASSPRIRSLTR